MRGRKVCGFLFALAIALLGSQTLGFDSVQIAKTFNPIFNFSPLHRKECIPSRKTRIKRVHMKFEWKQDVRRMVVLLIFLQK